MISFTEALDHSGVDLLGYPIAPHFEWAVIALVWISRLATRFTDEGRDDRRPQTAFTS